MVQSMVSVDGLGKYSPYEYLGPFGKEFESSIPTTLPSGACRKLLKILSPSGRAGVQASTGIALGP